MIIRNNKAAKKKKMQRRERARALVAVAAALVAYVPGARADLPVHCYFHEVPGVWDFFVGRLQPKDDGFDGHDKRCGMIAPGDPDGWQQLTP